MRLEHSQRECRSRRYDLPARWHLILTRRSRPTNSGISDSNRIVYTSYDKENVTIRDSAYGIYIYKKSYITVNGINFYSLRRFMRIYAGHYNTISYD